MSATSIRYLAQQIKLRHGTCQTISRKDLALFPCEVTYVQKLHEDDFPARTDYVNDFWTHLMIGCWRKPFSQTKSGFI